jgi:hypothetical protein
MTCLGCSRTGRKHPASIGRIEASGLPASVPVPGPAGLHQVPANRTARCHWQRTAAPRLQRPEGSEAAAVLAAPVAAPVPGSSQSWQVLSWSAVHYARHRWNNVARFLKGFWEAAGCVRRRRAPLSQGATYRWSAARTPSIVVHRRLPRSPQAEGVGGLRQIQDHRITVAEPPRSGRNYADEPGHHGPSLRLPKGPLCVHRSGVWRPQPA